MKKSSLAVPLLLTLFAGVASADARVAHSTRSARAFERVVNGFGVEEPTQVAKHVGPTNKLVLSLQAQLKKLGAATKRWSWSRVD